MACRTASRNFPGVMRLSKRCCLQRQHSLRYSFGFLLVDVGEGLLFGAEFIARCRLIARASRVPATRLLISSSVAAFEPARCVSRVIRCFHRYSLLVNLRYQMTIVDDDQCRNRRGHAEQRWSVSGTFAASVARRRQPVVRVVTAYRPLYANSNSPSSHLAVV